MKYKVQKALSKEKMINILNNVKDKNVWSSKTPLREWKGKAQSKEKYLIHI